MFIKHSSIKIQNQITWNRNFIDVLKLQSFGGCHPTKYLKVIWNIKVMIKIV